MKAILRLQELGFNFTLEGDEIHYVCRSPDRPEPSQVRPLLEEVKKRKEEAVRFLQEHRAPLNECYQLICEAMDRIAETYISGTIDRIKAQAPDLWQQNRETERGVDHACQSGRIVELSDRLKRLEALWTVANSE